MIAYNRTEEEVGEAIGADCIVYQSLESLINAVKRGNKGIQTFDCSVFDGKYVTGVSPDYLKELGRQRGESAKNQRKRQTVGVDLYNNA